MKLYRKKLDSLEALKREKIRLKYERMHSKTSDLNPLAEVGGNKMPGIAKVGVLGMAMELLNSKSHVHTAFTLSKPLLKMLRNRRAKKRAIQKAAGVPHKAYILTRAIKEVAVGYLTGKAVQMAVNGLKMYMRKRKTRKVLLPR